MAEQDSCSRPQIVGIRLFVVVVVVVVKTYVKEYQKSYSFIRRGNWHTKRGQMNNVFKL